MHPTALNNAKMFFDTYTKNLQQQQIKIIEIGSQDVGNGSLRQVCPVGFEYIGVDFQSGRGVDVIIDDPYCLPFEDASVDIVVSSSCFEHSEMFWLVFLEALRILKPDGIFYLNVPSSGPYHSYPADCWRFYPDSGKALITWATRNNYSSVLLESYIDVGCVWENFVAVFLKDKQYINKFTNRILFTTQNFENGWVYGESKIYNESRISVKEKKLEVIRRISSGEVKVK